VVSFRGMNATILYSPPPPVEPICRERWTAQRSLACRATDATVVATMAQRAEDFVHRSAEHTEKFLTRIAESESMLNPEDRQGLRQLAGALKDVVAVGRDTFQLGDRDDGQNRCIVNLAFLNDYEDERPMAGETLPAQ
jgi:hypothetical protein